MRSHLALTQVLLLTEPESLERTAPALWAMLEEVVSVFNAGEEVVHPVRRCVTPLPVDALEGVTTEEERLVLGSHIVPLLETPGRYAGTLDPGPLADRVRAMLSEHGHEAEMLQVVTDQEITPPPDWRYILWDGDDDWGVVSTAAMDPEYWGLLDGDPTALIKRRARAAAISQVGSKLGLARCENARCFLLGNVGSVLQLDRMRLIGDEHPDFPGAGRVGFASEHDELATPEPLADPTELDAEAWRR
jgi:hypothetical protein